MIDRQTFNQGVPCSSPGALTNKIRELSIDFEGAWFLIFYRGISRGNDPRRF
jgi:hypothetical protein